MRALIREEAEVSRTFFRDGAEPRPVAALRLLFFAVADSYCRVGPLDVEFDTDSELTTFLWNEKPILDIDVVSSVQANLRARYDDGGHERRVFVLLDFGDTGAKLVAFRNARRERDEHAADVDVIEM